MDEIVNDHFLMVTAIEPKDQGSQKCYLGPQTMKALDVYPGSWVLLQVRDHEVLCRVWPRRDLHDDYLQFDACIYKTKPDCVPSNKFLLNQEKLYTRDLVPVRQVSKIRNLNLILVVEGCVDDTSNTSQYIETCLSDHIKICLQNRSLFKKCVINFKSISPETYKHTKITNIVVEDFDVASQKSKSFHEIGNQTDLPVIGVVTMTTDVNICRRVSQERFDQQVSRRRYQLGGLAKAENMLKELISYPFDFPQSFERLGLECPKGILLQGPPGVGKTYLVKSVCSECNAYVLNVNAAAIFNSQPGESEENLRRAFKEANSLATEGPTVLFIDELDALCPKRSRGNQGLENRVVAQLLTLMDGLESRGKLVVIGATNRPNAVDVALRRPGRFDREVIIGVPNVTERKEILKVHTKTLKLASDVSLQRVAELTPGYVGADIAALCREASFNALTRVRVLGNEYTGCLQLSMSDFKCAINKIVPSTLRGSETLVDYDPVSWDSIGGLEDVKRQLKQAVEWPLKYSESFRRLGISQPKGVLLYGPPGCCKTTLVKAAATASNATFLAINGAQLYSPYVGDSEKAIAQVFHHARLGAPSIVFLDEVDSIIGKRLTDSRSGHNVQERVLATLLNEMDGISQPLIQNVEPEKRKIMEGENQTSTLGDKHSEKSTDVATKNNNVLLVAATNRPELVDSALLRPGRIDKLIFVPPPDLQARMQILSIYTKNMPLACDVNLHNVAQKTDLYSGADLANLCREAGLVALQEEGLETSSIQDCHFLTSLAASKASLTEEQIRVYNEMMDKV